ncbi:MAG: hypothetical protein RLZ56_1229 [Bacteroidota bacterium]|jgi:hypothetical protein
MQLSFEQQKNIKATLYTSIICVLLALLFMLTQWNQSPPVITPPAESFIEVNLGNSETGQGDTPPLSKEAPAPEIGASKPVQAKAAENTVKIHSNSNDANDEAIASAKATKHNKATPLPPAPKPKALMGKYAGGNGPGGNNQDSYNNVKDQGIAGGKGDQGVANGSINGKAYTGSGGPFVTKGDRHVTKVYSFNGDVEAATIYAEIEVSPNGTGRFIQIVKGSSSNDIKYKKAITEYLTKISFNAADHSSFVTVKFKFEVQ